MTPTLDTLRENARQFIDRSVTNPVSVKRRHEAAEEIVKWTCRVHKVKYVKPIKEKK